MKSFSDLEQSKKLAKILPLESADMYYLYDEHMKMYDDYPRLITDTDELWNNDTPCWSLAALLGIFPMIVGRDLGMYCCWQNSKNLYSRHYDNPVDACYEMILKLNEQKLL